MPAVVVAIEMGATSVTITASAVLLVWLAVRAYRWLRKAV